MKLNYKRIKENLRHHLQQLRKSFVELYSYDLFEEQEEEAEKEEKGASESSTFREIVGSKR